MPDEDNNRRPILNNSISAEEFRAFYWLKSELVDFCRSEGLRLQGSKIEIADRIEHYLKTGEKKGPVGRQTKKARSTFDWANAELTLETVITDNYKNSENVRAFFQQQIGKRFKFNVLFMNWMKANVGKSLADAIVAWKEIEEAKKNRSEPKEIAPQFEYNRYMRDFLADNPDKTRKAAIAAWNVKRRQRGDNVYHPSDLSFLDQAD